MTTIVLDKHSSNTEPGLVVRLKPYAIAYTAATLATLIKTIAWWFNQWPFINGYNFFLKWIMSASIAGFEYLPLTFSFQYAVANGVHLSLMTAYMEAADNGFRMLQQLGLGDRLDWFDWVAATLLAIFVMFQGIFHYRLERQRYQALKANHDTNNIQHGDAEVNYEDHYPEPDSPHEMKEELVEMTPFFIKTAVLIIFSSLILISLTSSLLGGPTGQAYTLATLATAAKTFAWWVNQYPALKNFTFVQKWLSGWSIAALIEYLPLMGAFTIASSNNVHLGLMTAYMEAIDNLFRMIQQYMLGKPLYWFDYTAASGMFIAVIFQGVMHFVTEKGFVHV